MRIFWTTGATILQDDTNSKLSYFKRYINVNTYNYQLLVMSINISGILIVEVDSNTKKETNRTNKSKTHTQKIIVIQNEKNESDKK